MPKILIMIVLLLAGLPDVALAVECPAGCVPREQAAEISPNADLYACPTGCVWYSDIIRRVGEKAPEPAPDAPPAIVPEPTLLETTTQPQTDATAPELAQDDFVQTNHDKLQGDENQSEKTDLESKSNEAFPPQTAVARIRQRGTFFPTGYGLAKNQHVVTAYELGLVEYQYGVTDIFQVGVLAPVPVYFVGVIPTLRLHGPISENNHMSLGVFTGVETCYASTRYSAFTFGGHLAWTGVIKRHAFTLGVIGGTAASFTGEWSILKRGVMYAQIGYRWEASYNFSLHLDVLGVFPIPFFIGSIGGLPGTIALGGRSHWRHFFLDYGLMGIFLITPGSEYDPPGVFVIPVPFVNLGTTF